MEIGSNLLFVRLLVVFLAAGFGLFVSQIAWRRGYYSLPLESSAERNIPKGRHVLEAFGIFLFIQMIFVPIIYTLWGMWERGSFALSETVEFPAEFHAWANLIIIALATTVLIVFFMSLDKPNRDAIWGSPVLGKGLKQNSFDFLIGSVSWLIAYPWVIVVGQLIAIVLSLFYTGSLPDQTAVKHLKSIVEYPLLFGLTVVFVVSVIPFLEEFLFRGFLQSWLKTTFGTAKAIILTSLIFASFHFSISQGVENLTILISLFILSCFLGFVKERQQSIWASVGLHSIFNFISVLMLFSE